MKKVITGICVLMLLVSSTTWAQGRSYERTDDEQEMEQGQGPGGGQRRGPPPEAIAICEGQDEGASCTFETPRGETITGTCETLREGDFACRPDNPPPGMGGMGPQGGGQRNGGRPPREDTESS